VFTAAKLIDDVWKTSLELSTSFLSGGKVCAGALLRIAPMGANSWLLL
jgi:hypothetical protein